MPKFNKQDDTTKGNEKSNSNSFQESGSNQKNEHRSGKKGHGNNHGRGNGKSDPVPNINLTEMTYGRVFPSGMSGLGRIPAEIMAGTSLPFANIRGDVTVRRSYDQPLVMGIDVHVMAGRLHNAYVTDKYDAIEKAGRAYDDFLNSLNASIPGFDSEDVAKFRFAQSNLCIPVAWLQLLLSVASTGASAINDASPRLIGEMMTGFDPKAESPYLADDIARFNRLMNDLNKIPIPADDTLTRRWFSMFSQVYADDPAITKTGYIVLRPTGYYTMDVDAESSSVGCLVYQSFQDTHFQPTSYHDVIKHIMDLLERDVADYLYDQDWRLLRASILRAFEKKAGQIMEWKHIVPPLTTFPVTFNQNMLDSIKNAHIVGNVDTLIIADDPTTGHLFYKQWDASVHVWKSCDAGIQCSTLGSSADQSYIINAHVDQPDETDIATLTQFMVTREPKSNSTYYLLKSFGTEVVTKVSVLRSKATSTTPEQYKEFIFDNHSIWLTDVTIAYDDSAADLLISTEEFAQKSLAAGGFSSAPRFDLVVVKYDEDEEEEYSIFIPVWGDIDNIFEIHAENLERIHDACVYSLTQPSLSMGGTGTGSK